jgi:penicillin amidase
LERIDIVRDHWGVPHVFAETDDGAFYGMGYATAQDRLYQMEFRRRYMYGTLSEMIGRRECSDPPCMDSVARDIFMRHMQFYSYAKARFYQLDPETAGFLKAYASGVNQYVADHPGELNELFDGQLPDPWMPWDSMLAWDYVAHAEPMESEVTNLHAFDDLVGQGYTSLEAATKLNPTVVYDDLGATVKQDDVPLATQRAMTEYDHQHPTFGGLKPNYTIAPHMSHAWAVSGDLTQTGEALLSGNPRQQITAPSFWSEIHIVGKTIDARGITIPGALGFFVGFTPYVAWTNTGTHGDLSDLYRLNNSFLGVEEYWFDGQVEQMACADQVVRIKGEEPIHIRVCNTGIGPNVTPILDAALPGEQYALSALPFVDRGRDTIQGQVGMMRAKSLKQFTDAIEGWRTPKANMIFATADNHIGYWYLGAVPTRSALSPLAGYMAQNGSASQYQWVEILPHDLRPHVIDPADGYVFNGNNLAAGSWYPIMNGSVSGGGETLRSARLREMLDMADDDGVITADEARDFLLDRTVPAYRDIMRAALQHRDWAGGVGFSSTARAAVDTLERWYQGGAVMAPDQPGYALAHWFSWKFRPANAGNLTHVYGEGEAGLAAFARHLRLTLDADPAYVLTEDEVEYCNWLLEDAWNSAQEELGSDPSQWKRNFRSHPTANQAAEYFDTLYERYGSLYTAYDQVYGPVNAPNAMTIWSDRGMAHGCFVDYQDVDDAESITPFGGSEHRDSPHFNDQVGLWRAGQLHPAPITRAAVDAVAESHTVITYAGG